MTSRVGSSFVAARTDPTGLSVDVVVNNHNYGRFVGYAIESALEQTHPDVKVIVVDDGSTDESRRVIERYEDRVEVVLKENGGQASSLNSGFVRSSGDIVIFLDSDDMLRPETAALVASAFAAHPGLSKVQYRMEVVDRTGRRSGILKPHPHLPLPQGDVAAAELVFPFDLVWLPTSGNAFSAAALRRILPIPERDFRGCADWYLVHLAPLLGPVVSLDDVGAYYRVHGRNSYEPQLATLDLAHIRQTIAYSAVTARAVATLADELGLERPAGHILSVSDLANRLISLLLEPDLHPVPADRRRRLVADGVRAAARRSDVAWPLKLLYGLWFAAMSVAPRRVAGELGERFLFPERRERTNRLIGRFHQRASGRESARPGAQAAPASAESRSKRVPGR